MRIINLIMNVLTVIFIGMAFYAGLTVGSRDARILVGERLLANCPPPEVVIYREGVRKDK